MNEQNNPKFQTAITLNHEILAGKYHSFTFKTENPLIYKPGQYLSIKVADNRINSYSIMNHEEVNKFIILVDTSPNGPGSKFFENLKVGEKISYLGPFGTFTFKDNDHAKELIFLGTGSGCSPAAVRPVTSWSKSPKARAGYGSANRALSVRAYRLSRSKIGGYFDGQKTRHLGRRLSRHRTL